MDKIKNKLKKKKMKEIKINLTTVLNKQTYSRKSAKTNRI